MVAAVYHIYTYHTRGSIPSYGQMLLLETSNHLVTWHSFVQDLPRNMLFIFSVCQNTFEVQCKNNSIQDSPHTKMVCKYNLYKYTVRNSSQLMLAEELANSVTVL